MKHKMVPLLVAMGRSGLSGTRVGGDHVQACYPRDYTIGNASFDVPVADFDGKLDLAMATATDVFIIPSNGPLVAGNNASTELGKARP